MKSLAYFFLTLIILSVSFATSFAGEGDPEMADVMRSNGKIYIVVAIILIVLTGLITYLLLLDRKVKKLEKILEGKSKKRS